jgi:hypothetical protein
MNGILKNPKTFNASRVTCALNICHPMHGQGLLLFLPLKKAPFAALVALVWNFQPKEALFLGLSVSLALECYATVADPSLVIFIPQNLFRDLDSGERKIKSKFRISKQHRRDDKTHNKHESGK